MDLKEIKQILKLMDTHGLTEFTLEKEDEKLVLRRDLIAPAPQQIIQAPAPVAAAPAIPAAVPVEAAAVPAEDSNFITIESPMVGTFYAAASPDSEPYVQVGQSIGPDTTVCIVEAMKIMNEIKAEVSGTIEQVCVQNGQPVEFGQALFKVRPV
ncbi:MAG: acetyl-CoA carboxylase biotin carboxyl carrier protein [Chlamydiae bacterium]|nr:MAG: acetyl-CoA carboxylase biotin carboxyl carrier protein [Chlamydiota bacterium]